MVFIDYRKLIGFSKGSYVITLPKLWIEHHNLKKGDIIGIEEDGNTLIFYAKGKEPERQEKSISISVENKSMSMIKAEIVSSYLNNNNLIEIFSNTLGDDALVIKSIIRNLSGMEIIEQTGTKIVAKDLIDINSIPIQGIVRRMDVITRSMIDDTIMCIQGKCNPTSIIDRDVDINRLYYLGFRVIKNAMEKPMLMNKMESNPWRLYSDKQVMMRIEEIADRQKRISRLINEAEFGDKTLEDFRRLKEDLRERYLDAMKSYYNRDKKGAYDIETTHKPFIERCDKFLEDTSKKTNLVPAAKIVEYTKASATFVRYIARTVLNMD